MDSSKVVFTVSILDQIVRSHKERLQRGVERRKEMFEAIKRGEDPSGPRPEWIKESALEVIELLKNQGAQFNADNPDDRASISDLLDVIATAQAMIKRSIKGD